MLKGGQVQVSVDGVPWVIKPGLHVFLFLPPDLGVDKGLVVGQDVDVGQGVDGVKDVDNGRVGKRFLKTDKMLTNYFQMF